MELTKQGIVNMVARSETTIKEMFSGLNANYIKTLELCAYYMDVGFTNCYSTSWAMLLFYPAPAMPMIEMTEFTRWYVQQSLYTSALSKLADYLNKLSCIGIEKHIEKYMSSCPQFFSEPDRAAGKTSGGPNNGDYCLPEEEVYCEISNQLVQTPIEIQYPRLANIGAKQEDSNELAKDNETIAENNDIVEGIKVKRGGSVKRESEFGHSSEVDNIKNTTSTYSTNHMNKVGTMQYETSIQLERTPQADQYRQTITIQEQEASSVFLERDQESASNKAVTDDTAKNTDTATGHLEEMGSTKEKPETSIRQEETSNEENYPQATSVKKNTENNDGTKRVTPRSHDEVAYKAVTNNTVKGRKNGDNVEEMKVKRGGSVDNESEFEHSSEINNINDTTSTYSVDHVEKTETSNEEHGISIQLERTLQPDQYCQAGIIKEQEVSSVSLEGDHESISNKVIRDDTAEKEDATNGYMRSTKMNYETSIRPEETSSSEK